LTAQAFGLLWNRNDQNKKTEEESNSGARVGEQSFPLKKRTAAGSQETHFYEKEKREGVSKQ